MNSQETPENVQRAAEIMAAVIKRILDGSTATPQSDTETANP